MKMYYPYIGFQVLDLANSSGALDTGGIGGMGPGEGRTE